MYGKQNIPQQRKRPAGYCDTVRFPDADVNVGAEVHPPTTPLTQHLSIKHPFSRLLTSTAPAAPKKLMVPRPC